LLQQLKEKGNSETQKVALLTTRIQALEKQLQDKSETIFDLTLSKKEPGQ